MLYCPGLATFSGDFERTSNSSFRASMVRMTT